MKNSKTTGLTLLLVLLSALAGYGLFRAMNDQSLPFFAGKDETKSQDLAAIKTVSKEFTEAYMNSDYQNLEATQQQLIKLSTGAFLTKARSDKELFDSSTKMYKIISKGKCVGVGINQFSDTSAIVYAAGSTRVTSSARKNMIGRTFLAQAKLQVVKVGSSWLVSNVEEVN